MKQSQFSYFFCRGYFDSANDIFECLKYSSVRHYAFILHNKDVYLDDGEDHKKGEHKKDHWHLIINVQEKCTSSALRKRFLSVRPDCGLWVRDVKKAEATFDYLTHATDEAIKEGKFRYDDELIFSDNIEYFRSKAFGIDVEKDRMDPFGELFAIVIDNGYLKKSIYVDFCKTYGRDFIINSPRCLQACAFVLGCSVDQVFMTPEVREQVQLAQQKKENSK